MEYDGNIHLQMGKKAEEEKRYVCEENEESLNRDQYYRGCHRIHARLMEQCA